MSYAGMGRPGVLILCVKDDRDIAESIAAYLEGKDMTVSLRDPDDAGADDAAAPGKVGWTAVVVLLSESAVSSDTFMPVAARLSHERVVPVCTTPVEAESIPAFMSELNWVLWYKPSAVNKFLSIFVGVNTDLGRYREAKSVEQEARAWQAAGRDSDYLIMDAARVEALRRQHSAATHDGTATYSQLALDFLQQSNKVSRRARWRRNSRWAFRLGIAAVVAAVIATIWPIVQATVASNKLSAVLLADETPGRPDLDAMKMSGLSLFFAENEQPVPKSVGHRIVRSLGESWAVGQIGGEEDLLVSAAALVGSDSLMTGDTQGRLGKLNLNTGEFDWMREVAGPPITAVEPARGSSVIGLADREDTIYLTEQDGRILWSAKAPGPVESIRTGSSGVLVLTTDGTVYMRASEQKEWTRHPAGNVLDAQWSPTLGGHVLSREGSELVLWDINGLRIRTWALPPTEFETASLDPTGQQMVTVGPGSQLWASLDGSRLLPTGVVTPDVVRELAITEAGTVVWATDALGAQVFDAAHTLSLGRICPSSTGEMLSVNTDIAGTRVVCVNGSTATVQDISDSLPRDSIPANLGLSDRTSFDWDGTAQTAEGPNQGATVEILPDGRVKFAAAGSSEILDPRANTFSGDARPRGSTPDGNVDSVFDPGTLWFVGEPTVVSVNSTGTTAAVGSSDGTVTELDLRPGGPALASRWTVPGQSAITQLGWSPDGGSLVVGTNRGDWFTPDSCAGCGSDLTKLLSAVNRRGWFCYPKEAVELFTGSAAQSLGIRQCALPSVQAQP